LAVLILDFVKIALFEMSLLMRIEENEVISRHFCFIYEQIVVNISPEKVGKNLIYKFIIRFVNN